MIRSKKIGKTVHVRHVAAVVLALLMLAPGAVRSLDARFEELVSVEASAGRDSVRVGERLPVTFTLHYPDSLAFLPVDALPEGRFMPIDVSWKTAAPAAAVRSTVGRIVIATIDLEQALLPPIRLRFRTASGDTLEGWTPEVRVPVRSVAAADSELKPIKQQWVAPRSLLLPVLAAVLLLLAAAGIILWRRLRGRHTAAEPLRPVEPPEVAAYRELARIEGSGILEEGRFKEYYTRVVDVLRRYIEGRFGIEAMDRTTDELLFSIKHEGAEIPGLEDILREADMVKFAKFSPGVASGTALMKSVRRIVAATTPRLEEASAAGGAGGNV